MMDANADVRGAPTPGPDPGRDGPLNESSELLRWICTNNPFKE